MKKFIFFGLVVLLLAACSLIEDKYDVEIGASDKFSEDEIQDAIDVAAKKLNGIKGADIKKIYYDEEKSNFQTEIYLTEGSGSETDYTKDNIIVLYSDFKTDKHGIEEGFDENETVTDWNVILARKDKNSKWKVQDWGY